MYRRCSMLSDDGDGHAGVSPTNKANLIRTADGVRSQGSFDFIATAFSSVADVTQFVSGSCWLLNLHSAACTSYLSLANGSTTVTETASRTLTGTQLRYVQIPITAGGEALTAADAQCTASTTVAANTPLPPTTGNVSSADDNNQGVRLEIGVGVGVGVALVLGGIAGFFLHRRRTRRKGTAGAADVEETKHSDQPPPPVYAATSPMSPAPHQQPYPAEIDSPSIGQQMGELPAEEKTLEMGAYGSPKAYVGPEERYEMAAGKP